jgi:hypothetical protein
MVKECKDKKGNSLFFNPTYAKVAKKLKKWREKKQNK